MEEEKKEEPKSKEIGKEEKDKIFRRLAKDIMRLRPKTIMSIPLFDDDFAKILNEYNISIGHLNGVVDILVLIGDQSKIPDGLRPRYILSPTDKVDGFNIMDNSIFTKHGFHLFERIGLLKICHFPLQPEGAVLWYRVQLPAMKMWEHYSDIYSTIVYPANYYDIYWSDIIVFQRYLPEFLGLMKHAKSLGKKVVYETDDLDIYIPTTNPLYWEYQTSNKIGEMKGMMGIADMITVTTNKLREELLKFNPNVSVMRNKIDLFNPVWNVEKKKLDKVVVGWVGGSSHWDDLQLLRGVISQVIKDNDAYLMICGYNKGGRRYTYHENKETGEVFVKEDKLERGVWDDIVDLFKYEVGDRLLIREALDVQQYPKFFHEIDIALAPLQDHRFNNGKSELKVVEAGGYGIPIVVSDVTPYREVIEHGKNGFFAKSSRDWVKYISRLIKDEKLRKEMGSNLRQTIEKNYDANDQKKRVEMYRKLKLKEK